MSTGYVGSVILYLGANGVEVTKINMKDSTGKKPVKTMNRTRRVRRFARGVGQYDTTFTVVVPTDGTTVDWVKIDDAKVSLVLNVEGARPTSYLGFCTIEADSSCIVDSELMVDVTGFAIREVLK